MAWYDNRVQIHNCQRLSVGLYFIHLTLRDSSWPLRRNGLRGKSEGEKRCWLERYRRWFADWEKEERGEKDRERDAHKDEKVISHYTIRILCSLTNLMANSNTRSAHSELAGLQDAHSALSWSTNQSNTNHHPHSSEYTITRWIRSPQLQRHHSWTATIIIWRAKCWPRNSHAKGFGMSVFWGNDGHVWRFWKKRNAVWKRECRCLRRS